MAPPRSRLGDLSPELLEGIVHHLALDPIPTGLFDPDKPPPPRDFLIDHKYVDRDVVNLAKWRRQRRDLLSLASTSRALRPFCEPLLWHSVAVHGWRGTNRLIDTLRHRSDIASLVQRVYLIGPAPEICINEYDPTDWYDPRCFLGEVEWDMGDLISCTPNVRDILCTCSPDTPAGMGGLLPTVVDQARRNFHQSELPGVTTSRPLASVPQLTSLRFGIRSKGIVSAESDAFDIFDILPFLPHLITLELSAASLDIWRPSCEIGDLRDEFLRPFNITARIAETLETSYLDFPYYETVEPDDDAYLKAPQLDATYPPLPGLRHLRVYGSSVSEFQIGLLVQRCLNLETLLVKFESGTAPDDMDGPPTEDCWINSALLARSRTLTSLTILGSSSGNVLHAQHPLEDVPENRRLWCLPQLTSLRHLTIDLYGLFGDPAHFTDDHARMFSSLVPPSVRSLELVPHWDAGRYVGTKLADAGSDFIYLGDILVAVRALLLFLRERPGQLHTLTLGLLTTGKDPRIAGHRNRLLRKLGAEARKAGVHFVVGGCILSFADFERAPGFDRYGCPPWTYPMRVWPRLEDLGDYGRKMHAYSVARSCNELVAHGLPSDYVSHDPKDWVPGPILRGEMS